MREVSKNFKYLAKIQWIIIFLFLSSLVSKFLDCLKHNSIDFTTKTIIQNQGMSPHDFRNPKRLWKFQIEMSHFSKWKIGFNLQADFALSQTIAQSQNEWNIYLSILVMRFKIFHWCLWSWLIMEIGNHGNFLRLDESECWKSCEFVCLKNKLNDKNFPFDEKIDIR